MLTTRTLKSSLLVIAFAFLTVFGASAQEEPAEQPAVIVIPANDQVEATTGAPIMIGRPGFNPLFDKLEVQEARYLEATNLQYVSETASAGAETLNCMSFVAQTEFITGCYLYLAQPSANSTILFPVGTMPQAIGVQMDELVSTALLYYNFKGGLQHVWAWDSNESESYVVELYRQMEIPGAVEIGRDWLQVSYVTTPATNYQGYNYHSVRNELVQADDAEWAKLEIDAQMQNGLFSMGMSTILFRTENYGVFVESIYLQDRYTEVYSMQAKATLDITRYPHYSFSTWQEIVDYCPAGQNAISFCGDRWHLVAQTSYDYTGSSPAPIALKYWNGETLETFATAECYYRGNDAFTGGADQWYQETCSWFTSEILDQTMYWTMWQFLPTEQTELIDGYSKVVFSFAPTAQETMARMSAGQ